MSGREAALPMAAVRHERATEGSIRHLSSRQQRYGIRAATHFLFHLVSDDPIHNLLIRERIVCLPLDRDRSV